MSWEDSSSVTGCSRNRHVHALNRSKGNLEGYTNSVPLHPEPLTSVHESKFHKANMHAHTQAGGQNKVVTPEEKIRMTKENGTEVGGAVGRRTAAMEMLNNGSLVDKI